MDVMEERNPLLPDPEIVARDLREAIDKDILETIVAAAKRLDSQPVPTEGRRMRYMGGDGKIYEIEKEITNGNHSKNRDSQRTD